MGVRSRQAVVAFLVAGVFGVARPESASSGDGRLACPELRSLTGYNFSITSARSVAAGNDAPAHCRVTGQVLPEIRFEVSLPASWNRRFYMFGNGGYAGEAFDAAGRVAQRNRALALGYAVASTNTGHDAASEPLASFATNRQKLLDYAFRAVHVTALAANKVRSHPASTGQDGMYYLYNVPAGAYYLEIWINGMNNRPLYYQIKVFEPYTDIPPIVVR